MGRLGAIRERLIERIPAGSFRWAKNIAIALAAAFLAHHFILGDEGYFARKEILAGIEAQRAEIEELNARKTELTAEIERLSTDFEAVEEVARNELHLAFPGETIYRFDRS